MIVDMSCPKCGGQATEYDEHKWTCLRCGNKFIYAPTSPSQTQNFVQNTVNVVGQPTYELDVQNAKPAKPIVKTRGEVEPDFFTKNNLNSANLPQLLEQRVSFSEDVEYFRVIIPKEQHKMALLGLSIICSGSITIVGLAIKSRPMIIYFITAFVCLLCLHYYLQVRRRKINAANGINSYELTLKELGEQIAEIEEEKRAIITVGYQPVCPYCLADGGEPTCEIPPGLTHCLKCGKQFHYSSQFSYPIKFK